MVRLEAVTVGRTALWRGMRCRQCSDVRYPIPYDALGRDLVFGTWFGRFPAGLPSFRVDLARRALAEVPTQSCPAFLGSMTLLQRCSWTTFDHSVVTRTFSWMNLYILPFPNFFPMRSQTFHTTVVPEWYCRSGLGDVWFFLAGWLAGYFPSGAGSH